MIPLDWNRGAGRPEGERPRAVDVIIPIYGAAALLRSCLESVAAETDLATHRILLVVDGPQERAVDAVIEGFVHAHPDAVRVLRNDERLGFVASVNRGMSSSATDVVLLNSDTVVTRRWLENLIDAAYSAGDVGTVTPLSNHATLCSVPRAFEENLLPTGFDVASFAALVTERSTRSYPRIPTGVGVCLYIRRALLNDIGLFDAARFGLGYGEENDFCMRALDRGWLHVADDATFIYHAGHASFGKSRARLQRRARATLRRLHPRYMATIADFMKRDPLAAVRANILRVILSREDGEGPPDSGAVGANRRRSFAVYAAQDDTRRRIVHLVHGWPPFQQAGTELYASWLVCRQRNVRQRNVSVYARSVDPSRADGEAVELLDDGVRVRLVTNSVTARNPFRRNALRDRSLERDFERFLREERPQLLHVHHLAGHAFSLVHVARRLGIPIVLQIQDWWFLCARVNLCDRDGNRCTGPGLAKCARCATLTRVASVAVSNRMLHVLRKSAARAAIAACDAYVVGSNAIRDDYVRAGVIPPSKPVHVIPYGVDIVAPREPRASAIRPIRFGYVGSIAPHKGVHTAVEAMRGFDPSEATLHMWGDDTAFPDYVARLKGASFEGRFREEEKPRVFASMDVLLVPSIGLESFGLAAREAMVCGVPVIATEGGALSEMFAPGVCGEFFPAGDVDALRRILRRIVDEPAILDRWSAQLPKPKSTDVHAAEIERVYESVLAARLECGGKAAAFKGRGKYAAAATLPRYSKTAALPPHSTLRTIARVIRGEGLTSALVRASERIAEASRSTALRARGAFVKAAGAAILNVSAADVSARLGGVQVQLIARLRAESALRNVALLHPGVLELSAPVRHTRGVAGDFGTAIRQALAITGAKTIHLEGTDGLSLPVILGLVDEGIRVVVSVHDFSLFCARPHLLELPMEHFCWYSEDLDRCHRCLRETFDVAYDAQAERRALGRRLLASATGLIFPSRFLFAKHRELFSLPDLAGEVIEPGVPSFAKRSYGARPAIAYAGSAKRHKGAHLLPEIIRLAGEAEWHIFGGGDEDLLRALRQLPNVTVHGYYRNGRLPSLLTRHRVGLVVLPSIWPETHCLVLSEAWLAGAAAVAFDLGAPAERIRRDGGGWLAPLDSGAAGLAEIVRQWRSGTIAADVPSLATSPLDAARAHVDRYRAWGSL